MGTGSQAPAELSHDCKKGSFVLRCYNKLCMKSTELAFRSSTFLICVAEKLKQYMNI